MFWDTLPVVVIPMLMSMVLAMETVRRRDADKSMTFLLATGISPSQIIMTKAVFVGLSAFVLLAFSMLLGSVLHVYDLTGMWNQNTYIVLNLGAMCLQLFIAGWCFFLFPCAGSRPSMPFLLRAWHRAAAAVLCSLSAAGFCAGAFRAAIYHGVQPVPAGNVCVAGSFAFLASLTLAVAGLVFFGLGRYVFCGRGAHD